MVSSVHIDIKNKDILILDEGRTQRLYHTVLTAEAKYPIHFTQSRKRFLLDLQCNESNRFLMVKKYFPAKQKNLK